MKLHSVTDPPDVIHIYMIILQVLAIVSYFVGVSDYLSYN